MAEEPPQDHTSDQENTEDKESSSEVNQRANGLEFIKEFQEIMNKAIEQLLNKPARDILAAKRNLNCMWNRESIGKAYTGKQRSSHNMMLPESLMTSETVSFHRRQWIQTSASKDSLGQNQKVLTILNGKLRTPPNTG